MTQGGERVFFWFFVFKNEQEFLTLKMHVTHSKFGGDPSTVIIWRGPLYMDQFFFLTSVQNRFEAITDMILVKYPVTIFVTNFILFKIVIFGEF